MSRSHGSPLRIGVAGCGIISRAHLRACASTPHVVATAASSRTEAALNEVADDFGIPRRFADWRDLVSSDEIDAVLICLPDGLHHEVTLEAARHGKHILVEKAMANDLEQCRSMVDAADDAGLVLMVAQVTRCLQSHRVAKDMLHQDRIGTVSRVSRRRHWMPDKTIPALRKRPWIADSQMCTDPLLYGLGSHEYDAVLWLCASEAQTILARGDWDEAEWPGWKSIDGSMRLRSGVDVEMSQSVVGAQEIWETRVEGSAGTMAIYEDRVVVDGCETPCPRADEFTVQLEEFATCVREGQEPGPSGRNVLATMAVLEGVLASLREERSVDIPELGVGFP